MNGEIDFQPLREAAEAEIANGLAACQLAIGRDGKILWTESFGTADTETRFPVASATKPIVASAIWLLLGDGLLDLKKPVSDYVPEFRENGKEAVTVEQVLLMTCGFPDAPMGAAEGADPKTRIERLANWRIDYEPGTKYVYHGVSAHWVLAELIERISGVDFRDFIEQRVTRPLGLPRLLGIPRDQQTNIAALSVPEVRARNFDQTAVLEAGVPGGGGAMTAETLARFYQALLHNPENLWRPEILRDATTNIRCTLPDPLMNLPANRTLGVVIGAGFGTTWGESPTAFGWPGMGGQVGFAEPETGISFAFFQSGDADEIHQFVRAIRFSNMALALGR
jgi:CubicO group peptidase (beta-lactamase class C family)